MLLSLNFSSKRSLIMIDEMLYLSDDLNQYLSADSRSKGLITNWENNNGQQLQIWCTWSDINSLHILNDYVFSIPGCDAANGCSGWIHYRESIDNFNSIQNCCQTKEHGLHSPCAIDLELGYWLPVTKQAVSKISVEYWAYNLVRFILIKKIC